MKMAELEMRVARLEAQKEADIVRWENQASINTMFKESVDATKVAVENNTEVLRELVAQKREGAAIRGFLKTTIALTLSLLALWKGIPVAVEIYHQVMQK